MCTPSCRWTSGTLQALGVDVSVVAFLGGETTKTVSPAFCMKIPSVTCVSGGLQKQENDVCMAVSTATG